MFTMLYSDINEMFWITWGGFATAYMFFYSIKSMGNSPILLRIAFWIGGVGNAYVAFENYVKLTRDYNEIYKIIEPLGKPILIVSVLFLLGGCYQYVQRPGCDPKKRTAFYQILWTLIIAIVGFNILIRI